MIENCIYEKITIKEAISILDRVENKLLVVLAADNKVAGCITDGDIRRGILRGICLDACASTVMNHHPIVMHQDDSKAKIIALMEQELIFYVPLLNANNEFFKLVSLKTLKNDSYNDCAVFILAGGLGSRLKDLTKNMPKPMLPINGRPMLERLVLSFKEQGFAKFYLSVNYLREKIIDYFGDGSEWGVQIKYIAEDERLGTAGPLSLLDNAYFDESKYIVINSDVRVNTDFHALVRYHVKTKNILTVCAKEHEYQIPYGVIRFDDDTVISIDEKPVSSYFVSAGIYLIDRSMLNLLDKNIYCDMPDYINKVKAHDYKVGLYPLHESWIDVGLPSEYEKVVNNV